MRSILVLLLLFSTVLCQFQLQKVSYLKFPHTGQSYGMLTGAAHKAAYHAQERILYVLGAQSNSSQPRLLHIVDVNIPTNPQIIHTHQFDPDVNGRANDIAICPDTVAVSLEATLRTKEGHIELFTPFKRGDFGLTLLGREPVGVDPKGMAFTQDCQKLVIANEARGDYVALDQKFYDPPGTVTIMLRSDGGFPSFVTIGFQTILQNREVDYLSRGVRWVFKGDHQNGIVNNMWDDMEPETVAISLDQRFAYVSLPENNAVARIDLNAYNVQEIFSLGLKDWYSSLYRMDASDQDGGPNLVRYRMTSMYQPTDVKVVPLVNSLGQTVEYLASANQGVIKRYTAQQLNTPNGFDDSRRALAVANGGEFDESAWTGTTLSADVRDASRLGRLHIRHFDAQDSITRLIRNVTAYGGRSVSLWETSTMSLAFDTGEELELKELQKYQSLLNGDVSNLNASPTQETDLRSDDYGTEPTCLGIGSFPLGGSTNVPMVVVGTRTGFIHLYSDELFVPSHMFVHRDGGVSQTWSTLYNSDQAGDAIISDIGIIDPSQSPDGQMLVYVIGSGSGSLGLYHVQLSAKRK